MTTLSAAKAGEVAHIETEAEWESALADNDVVIVDFTAQWCGPCRTIGPYFDDLAPQFPNVKFIKVDVDKLEKVAQGAGITAMPTFHVYKGGKKSGELIGASKDKLRALVVEHAGAPTTTDS
mmetsp:Transcript_15266/g.46133  ORF Transcript_15266/g.46133 Transcript_15266/m.46133 type:complete len:122 (-) Transcript_15266:973-1338(-)